MSLKQEKNKIFIIDCAYKNFIKVKDIFTCLSKCMQKNIQMDGGFFVKNTPWRGQIALVNDVRRALSLKDFFLFFGVLQSLQIITKSAKGLFSNLILCF